MKLEQEAQEYLEAKSKQLNKDVDNTWAAFDILLDDVLLESEEKTTALQRLYECLMWARLDIKNNKIK
jgi:hypothetical protein